MEHFDASEITLGALPDYRLVEALLSPREETVLDLIEDAAMEFLN